MGKGKNTSINPNVHHWIEAYLDGNLSESDQKKLDQLLYYHPEFIQDIFKQAIIHQELTDFFAKPYRNFPVIRWRVVVGIAAVLLLFFGLGVMLWCHSFRSILLQTGEISYWNVSSSGIRQWGMVGSKLPAKFEFICSQSGVIQLPDHTLVYISKLSNGKIDWSPWDSTRLKIHRGNFSLNVSPQRYPLIVVTPHTTIHVVGTNFQITATQKRTIVKLLRGQLLIQTPLHHLHLVAGQTIQINEKGYIRFLHPSPKDSQKLLEWTWDEGPWDPGTNKIWEYGEYVAYSPYNLSPCFKSILGKDQSSEDFYQYVAIRSAEYLFTLNPDTIISFRYRLLHQSSQHLMVMLYWEDPLTNKEWYYRYNIKPVGVDEWENVTVRADELIPHLSERPNHIPNRLLVRTKIKGILIVSPDAEKSFLIDDLLIYASELSQSNSKRRKEL